MNHAKGACFPHLLGGWKGKGGGAEEAYDG